MNASARVATALCLSLCATPALAEDRAACNAGNEMACARLGELKQQGALTREGTKDVGALGTACARAVEAASGKRSMSAVARACKQLFNAELQKSWSAIASIDMPGADQLYGTAFAEAYCPKLSAKTKGCVGKRAANFSNLKSDETREALRALTTAALVLELGAEKGTPLAEKLNGAWGTLLGAP